MRNRGYSGFGPMNGSVYTTRSSKEDLENLLAIGRSVGYLARALGLKHARPEIYFGGTLLKPEQLRFFVSVDATNYIVGCVIAAAAEKSWHIISLWVNPACRRQGIGSDLLTAMCMAAKNDDAEYITLEAAIDFTWHVKFLGDFGFQGLSGDELDNTLLEIRESFPDVEFLADPSVFLYRRSFREEGSEGDFYQVREAKHSEIGLLENIRRQLSPPDMSARFMDLKKPGSPFSSFLKELTAHRLWVVANAEGQLLGFAVVGEVDGHAYVSEFMIGHSEDEFVSGTRLAQAISSWALKAGYGGVTVSAFRSLSSSMQVFRELGFSELFEINFGPKLLEISGAERAAGIPSHARIILSLSFTAVRF